MARRYYTVKNAGTYLARRDAGWVCHYCERKIKRNPSLAELAKGIRRATVDHKKPLAKGGEDNVTNLVLSCKPCNDEKGIQDYIVYRTLAWNRRRRLKARGKSNAT